MRLVLASGSPRRKQLLEEAGWDFLTLPVDIDETVGKSESPLDYGTRIAVAKSDTAINIIRSRSGEPSLIVSADTIVVDNFLGEGEDILGKPKNRQNAKDILLRLRNRSHTVITVLTMTDSVSRKRQTDHCITEVPMRNYSKTEIDQYVESGDPLDKAGAYAIQNQAFHPVHNLQGCYANVVGLPLCNLERNLRTFGLEPRVENCKLCKDLFGYECQVFEAILKENWIASDREN